MPAPKYELIMPIKLEYARLFRGMSKMTMLEIKKKLGSQLKRLVYGIVAACYASAWMRRLTRFEKPLRETVDECRKATERFRRWGGTVRIRWKARGRQKEIVILPDIESLKS